MQDEVAVASSYIDDFRKGLEDLPHNQFDRERVVNEMRKDLKRADKILRKAESAGIDVRALRARMLVADARGYSKCSIDAPDFLVKKNTKIEVELYKEAIELDPCQVYYFNQGLNYRLLGRKAEAATCFQAAIQGADQDTTMEAKKALFELNEKKGPCFVATVCYASAEHPDVEVFRMYRDATLMRHPMGRLFVDFYYKAGPRFAAFVESHPRWRSFIRRRLESVARHLRKRRLTS